MDNFLLIACICNIYHFIGSITRFLSSLRAVDDLNLSFSQQMQIIMKDVPSSSKTIDEDQNSEKSRVETEDDHEVSNTHRTETEDDGLVGDMDQIQSEADQVSELMDRVVKAVNVARQDNFP